MHVVTHGNLFHADDVFAMATLRLLGLVTSLTRSINPATFADPATLARADARIDIGRKYNPETGDFDHHQEGGAGVRPNGVPYASFGLVWANYGAKLCGSLSHATVVDERLVQTVDSRDVGHDLYPELNYPNIAPYSISDAISAFNPPWHKKPQQRDFDKRFHDAVGYAMVALENEIVTAEGAAIAKETIDRALSKAGQSPIIVLDRSCPRQELILDNAPYVLFMIVPTGGQWTVRVVQESRGILKARRYLPQNWAGKEKADFQGITGVPDAAFCHNSRFIAAAQSKNGALALAMLALESPV